MPKPLAGKTILVTRARSQAGVFSAALKELGAGVIEIPTIEIVPAKSPQLDRAICSLDEYDWLLFTSANGARIFFERLSQLLPKPEAAVPRVCAIGPATSKEIRCFGYDVALQPALFQAEGILDEFSILYEGRLSGLKILVPRARFARQILPEKLREFGAEVEVIPVYDTKLPSESADLLKEALSEGRLDLITFTSSSTVHNFIALASDLGTLSHYECAVIGPITAKTAEEYGLRVVLQPANSTIPDFLRAIEAYLTSSGES